MNPKIITISYYAGYMLTQFTNKELREYAKSIGVPIGRNKQDTIDNLMYSGKATICATLGD